MKVASLSLLGLFLLPIPLLAGVGILGNSANYLSVGVQVVPVNGSVVPQVVMDGIQQGMEQWNSTACNVGSNDFPVFNSFFGSMTLMVEYSSGFGPLDTSTSNTVCGRFIGNADGSNSQISLYGQIRLANGEVFPCQNPGDDSVVSDRMAHELGHYLGLGHPTCTPAAGAPYIMNGGSFVISGGQIWWSHANAIAGEECTTADSMSVTPGEPTAEGTEGPIENNDNPNPHEGPPEDPATPILIDLDTHGYRLGSLADPVPFDLNGDGLHEWLSWTEEGTDDAFLALDRNGNSFIDNGLELFGNYTVQPETAEPNGFHALARYDHREFGGDEDGWITPRDLVFAELLLWQDRNRDGVSQGSELSPLHEQGVVALELRVRDSRRRDRHGNWIRWASRLGWARGYTLGVADVIFLQSE